MNVVFLQDYQTRKQAEQSIFEYIVSFYNDQRIRMKNSITVESRYYKMALSKQITIITELDPINADYRYSLAR